MSLPKQVVDRISADAIKHSNNTRNAGKPCPSEAMNPGLYFGYVAGGSVEAERAMKLVRAFEELSSKLDCTCNYTMSCITCKTEAIFENYLEERG